MYEENNNKETYGILVNNTIIIRQSSSLALTCIKVKQKLIHLISILIYLI